MTENQKGREGGGSNSEKPVCPCCAEVGLIPIRIRQMFIGVGSAEGAGVPVSDEGMTLFRVCTEADFLKNPVL